MYDSSRRDTPWFDAAGVTWRLRKNLRKAGGKNLYVDIGKDAHDALKVGVKEMGTQRGAVEYALLMTFGPDAED